MPLYPNLQVPIHLSMNTTTATGDGADVVTVPFNCNVFAVHMKMGANGSGSGQTDVTVYYTKPTGGVSTTGDLWTVASGVGRMAHDSSALYLRWAAASCALTKLEKGGTLSLNVDAVAGTPGTNLEVILWVVPTDLS